MRRRHCSSSYYYSSGGGTNSSGWMDASRSGTNYCRIQSSSSASSSSVVQSSLCRGQRRRRSWPRWWKRTWWSSTSLSVFWDSQWVPFWCQLPVLSCLKKQSRHMYKRIGLALFLSFSQIKACVRVETRDQSSSKQANYDASTQSIAGKGVRKRCLLNVTHCGGRSIK